MFLTQNIPKGINAIFFAMNNNLVKQIIASE